MAVSALAALVELPVSLISLPISPLIFLLICYLPEDGHREGIKHLVPVVGLLQSLLLLRIASSDHRVHVGVVQEHFWQRSLQRYAGMLSAS